LISSNAVDDQAKKTSNPCPRCSREMESGYLLTPSAYFRSVRWATEWAIDFMELKGETIVPADLTGSIKIAGYRCKECKLLILSY
jgi:hypothetical protein